MVHATDMLVHQPDLASLKMEAMKHMDFGLLDITVVPADFESPPDTPSSSDDEYLLPLDRHWDAALFQDTAFLEGLAHHKTESSASTSSSCSSSGASSTVMWNVGHGGLHDLEFDSFLSSPSSPDADLLVDTGVLEDVFGLPMAVKEETKPAATAAAAATVVKTTPTASPATTTSTSTSTPVARPATTTNSSSVTISGSTTTHGVQPARPIKKHHHHPMVILSHPKSAGSKRRLEDEMEAKKARARQTRDEISAKAVAAMRQGGLPALPALNGSPSATTTPSSFLVSASSSLFSSSGSAPSTPSAGSMGSPMLMSAAGSKLDNPELRRITHNVLERKRREDLKNSYQDLRYQIPELAQNDRAPTGQILLKAVEMIEALKREDAALAAGIAAARAEQDRLRARLMAATAAN